MDLMTKETNEVVWPFGYDRLLQSHKPAVLASLFLNEQTAKC